MLINCTKYTKLLCARETLFLTTLHTIAAPEVSSTKKLLHQNKTGDGIIQKITPTDSHWQFHPTQNFFITYTASNKVELFARKGVRKIFLYCSTGPK